MHGTEGKSAAPRGRLLQPRRLALLAGLAAAIALFFGLGLQRYFSIAEIQANSAAIKAWAAANPAIAVPAFILVYAAAIVVFPPSGTVMTLTGGYVFGTWLAGTYVTFGATMGATALFLIAKTALGDPLRQRAGPFAKKMEDGFQKNALSYMLVLRLIPLFPFWLVNLAPAFLGVSTRVFVTGTFFGIIPGTFVYASVGGGLSEIVASEDIVGALHSPRFIGPVIALAVLALVPVAYRQFRAQRSYTKDH